MKILSRIALEQHALKCTGVMFELVNNFWCVRCIKCGEMFDQFPDESPFLHEDSNDYYKALLLSSKCRVTRKDLGETLYNWLLSNAYALDDQYYPGGLYITDKGRTKLTELSRR